ncbi:hypothetical protein IVA94_22395 [Bradyrhizobium sp. 156]|uniref:hypothetical protein n=1 Tax=Bradyrhizobium sp. 156 TaxID=2782630 RepID=UPI001FFAC41F|nr:hypothetical protein [Bradyrhizobium sp. 156]MCK1323597.1 hypothetical protein [Bradyrhizobium sp. 156]
MTPQQLADCYVALWNETDADARRQSIEAFWTPEGRHFVRTREVHGYESLQERVTASHESNVRDNGNVFRARQDARRVQDVVTFHWEMVPAGGGDVLAVGLEVLIVDGEGGVVTDYQFV